MSPMAKDSLKAGIGIPTRDELGTQPQHVHVFNVSRNLEWRGCPQKHHNQYVRDRVWAAGGPKPALLVGTAAHLLCQRIVEGVDAGDAYIEATKPIFDLLSRGISEAVYAKLSEGVGWLRELATIYPDRLEEEKPFDRVLFQEEPVWIWWPSARMLLVGRPDAVVEVDGRAVHCQRKTKGNSFDLEGYVNDLAFSPHEAAYGMALHLLHEQGDLELPYGGSLIELLIKKRKPVMPDGTLQKGIDPEHNPKVRKVTREYIEFVPDVTDRQRAQARKMWKRWSERFEIYDHSVQSWRNHVVQWRWADLDLAKLTPHFWELFDVEAAALNRSGVWRNQNYCHRWGSGAGTCQYIGTEQCAGFYDLDDNDVFTDREPDYIDEIREELNK